MEKVKTAKATIQDSAKIFLEEQALMRSYLKGKISKKSINERGIKPKLPPIKFSQIPLSECILSQQTTA